MAPLGFKYQADGDQVQASAANVFAQTDAHQTGRGQLAVEIPVEPLVGGLDLHEPLHVNTVAHDPVGQLGHRYLLFAQ